MQNVKIETGFQCPVKDILKIRFNMISKTRVVGSSLKYKSHYLISCFTPHMKKRLKEKSKGYKN